MRVIAGQAGGCALKAPRGMRTRPTSDRVKEAVFNILGPRVPGSLVLDLFAGTGGIGIEALSRGAEHATFVENGKTALQIIKENLAHTRLTEFGRILAMDVFRAGGFLAERGEKFDLIFLDPPYAHGLAGSTLRVISDRGLLCSGGLVVVETGRREEATNTVGELLLMRSAFYGDTAIHFYGCPDGLTT